MRTFVFSSEINSLQRPEDVASRQDHNECRDDRQQVAEVPNRKHNEDFADEPAKTWQTKTCEEQRERQRRVKWHLAIEPTKLFKVSVMDSVVNHADHEEHARRTHTVSDHLVHRTFDTHVPVEPVVALRCSNRHHAEAKHHIAHVTDRAIRHHPLEVLLRERGEGTVYHADHADRTNEPAEVVTRLGADRITDSQDSIAAHLQKDASQDH